jgi:hypothetical protein
MKKQSLVAELPEPPKKHSFHWLLNKTYIVEQLPKSISWTEPVKEPTMYKLKYDIISDIKD